GLGGGPAPGAGAGRRRLQPGIDGSRRVDLYPASAELPVVSLGRTLPGATAGLAGPAPNLDPETTGRGRHGGLRGRPPPRRGPDRAEGPGTALGAILGVP